MTDELHERLRTILGARPFLPFAGPTAGPARACGSSETIQSVGWAAGCHLSALYSARGTAPRCIVSRHQGSKDGCVRQSPSPVVAEVCPAEGILFPVRPTRTRGDC